VSKGGPTPTSRRHSVLHRPGGVTQKGAWASGLWLWVKSGTPWHGGQGKGDGNLFPRWRTPRDVAFSRKRIPSPFPFHSIGQPLCGGRTVHRGCAVQRQGVETPCLSDRRARPAKTGRGTVRVTWKQQAQRTGLLVLFAGRRTTSQSSKALSLPRGCVGRPAGGRGLRPAGGRGLRPAGGRGLRHTATLGLSVSIDLPAGR